MNKEAEDKKVICLGVDPVSTLNRPYLLCRSVFPTQFSSFSLPNPNVAHVLHDINRLPLFHQRQAEVIFWRKPHTSDIPVSCIDPMQ